MKKNNIELENEINEIKNNLNSKINLNIEEIKNNYLNKIKIMKYLKSII